VARRDDTGPDRDRPDRRPDPRPLEARDPAAVERRDEPPVVARLVVEIRSDGSHTIARGAMEDAASGQGVAIEASGRTPLQLALSLARALVSLPAFGRSARALLRGASRDRRKDSNRGDSGGGGRGASDR
jgi:hypothetical protein